MGKEYKTTKLDCFGEGITDKKELLSTKFWQEIFDSEWHDTPETKIVRGENKEVFDFVKNAVSPNGGYFNRSDVNDMVVVLEVCKNIASRYTAIGCIAYKVLPIIDGCSRWNYLAFGWGDPHLTSSYSYTYFDFDEELVYIDDNGHGYVYTFQELFRELYR